MSLLQRLGALSVGRRVAWPGEVQPLVMGALVEAGMDLEPDGQGWGA